MSESADINKWLTPQTLLGIFGMLGAIGGAWMSFDSRISKVESASLGAEQRMERIERANDRIENKIDKLLLAQGGH